MLRMALIASLVVLNLSVWVGPAEVLAARGKALLDPGPRYERAQRYIMDRDYKAAANEYRALVKAFPDNATYHAEFGLLCFNNAAALLEDSGWRREELIRTTQSELLRARELSPGDFSAAAQYALTLMDEDFFGDEIAMETVLESWEYIVSLHESKSAEAAPWNGLQDGLSHAYLQLTRVAARFGDVELARRYAGQARAFNPDIRIAEELLAGS